MGDEQDSWFKKAFGVDPGEALQGIENAASAMVTEVKNKGGQVVQGVQQVVNAALDEATGAAKKILGPAKPPAPKSAAPPGGGAAGGTGSFPLSGAVGRGGKNASGDVRAVQAALGIPVDGQCGPQTIAAIVAFQKKLGQSAPDGRVDAGGATERALAGKGAPAPAPAPEDASGEDEDSLFGKLAKGAKDLAGGLEDLGGKVVQGALDLDPSVVLDSLGSDGDHAQGIADRIIATLNQAATCASTWPCSGTWTCAPCSRSWPG